MLTLLRLTSVDLGSAATQYNEQLLVPSRTVAMAVVACGWEFIAETTRSTDVVRILLLIVPQLLLLVMVASQFLPVFKLHTRNQIIVVSVVITPMVAAAVIYSSFRLGIGLCCCSRMLCPATAPAPNASACGLVVNNCYMAFIRKIAHFYGAASLLPALASVIFATLRCTSRQAASRTHCQAILRKTH
ncbi:hypothetical protein GN244_ATG10504 [Phytophthora infestans]|uniref:Transmembrane protein n=1 Tax=Phytophthora infestans TaxID=4787 RepID=A0A833WU71_PHYIN|nr:hypothetical protein GN244_ATG10504 [Phytophthora infestans]KAF4142470.1 hypothetical protein GN958_ATG08344 [Phytophthora infestans]KAI9990134.1 hypothetical protein PInf_020560 [Phytophthora infestans]